MLNTSELLLLSTALGADLFSVAIPIGVKHICWRLVIRAAVVFAIFHIVMILAGVMLGCSIGNIFENIDWLKGCEGTLAAKDWAKIFGAAVLMLLGLRMIKEKLDTETAAYVNTSLLQGKALWLLALSVSVDAFAAGFSLGMVEVELIKLCIILGVVIFGIAVIGLGLGRKLGSIIGDKAELAGGLTLILLGGHIIWLTL